MKYFSLYPINIFSAGAAAQPPGGRAPLLRPRLLSARPRGLQPRLLHLRGGPQGEL